METERMSGAFDITENPSWNTSLQQTLRHACHLILPNKNRNRILAEVLPDRFARLPRTELPPDMDYSHSEIENLLERRIEAELGLSVHLARVLRTGLNEPIPGCDAFEINRLYLGDVLDDQTVLGERLVWIHRNVACGLKWVAISNDEEVDHVVTDLKQVFAEINGEVCLMCTEPWMNVGWLERITLWSRQVLDAKNIVIQGRLRQWHRTLQSVVMKCVVRMRDEREGEGRGEGREDVFIKCTLPFVREVEQTVAIAGVMGDIVPEIIGFREREELLMMRNGGKICDEPFDQDAFIDTIVTIQNLSMNHIGALLAGGVRVRDIEWLEANVEAILNHEVLDACYARNRHAYEGNKEIIDTLRAKVGLIRKQCREIIRLRLPKTLVHGELYELNVGRSVKSNKKVYRIFDWGRSFIGNPLHDFGAVLKGISFGNRGGCDLSIDRKAVVDRLCKQWNVCANMTSEELFSVFDVLSDLKSIISIHGLAEQYDACGNRHPNRKDSVLCEVHDWIEDTVERLSQ